MLRPLLNAVGLPRLLAAGAVLAGLVIVPLAVCWQAIGAERADSADAFERDRAQAAAQGRAWPDAWRDLRGGEPVAAYRERLVRAGLHPNCAIPPARDERLAADDTAICTTLVGRIGALPAVRAQAWFGPEGLRHQRFEIASRDYPALMAALDRVAERLPAEGRDAAARRANQQVWMLANGIVIARRGDPLPMAFATFTSTEYLEAVPCDKRPAPLRSAPSAATG